MITERKTLLLNHNDEILAFVSDRRAIRLLFKDKVDVLESWDDVFLKYKSNMIKFPSVIKLKYFVKKNYPKMIFSKKAILKRDNYRCQYCDSILRGKDITIDHVIPKSLGGQSSFQNCVAACHTCNNKKSNLLLEQTNMKLLRSPITPAKYLFALSEDDPWHESWNKFI